MTIKVAPLPASFMAMSMIGYFASMLMVYPRWPSFGFAFTLVFIIMFIASVISMTYSDAKESLMIDTMKRRKK